MNVCNLKLILSKAFMDTLLFTSYFFINIQNKCCLNSKQIIRLYKSLKNKKIIKNNLLN